MNTREVRFNGTRAREPVSKRFEQNYQQETPRTRSQSKKNDCSNNGNGKKLNLNCSQDRTLINSFRIEKLDECDSSSSARNRTLNVESSCETSTSCSDECEEYEEEEDCEEKCSILTELCDDETFYVENKDFQDSLSLLDKNCQKVVEGRDLLQIYYSFAKWFNNLKDAFTLATSTPVSTSTPCNQNKTIRINLKESSGKRSNRSCSMPSRVRSRTPKEACYDDVCQITGNLSKDKCLRLKYEANEECKPWDESSICRYFKYRYLIEKKCCFYDKLIIIPGIGTVYMSRLCCPISNVGTLFELFLSVEECTFKALLKSYAKISHLNLNLIYTSCKKYIRKFGFSFNDVLIRSPRSFEKKRKIQKIAMIIQIC